MSLWHTSNHVNRFEKNLKSDSGHGDGRKAAGNEHAERTSSGISPEAGWLDYREVGVVYAGERRDVSV